MVKQVDRDVATIETQSWLEGHCFPFIDKRIGRIMAATFWQNTVPLDCAKRVKNKCWNVDLRSHNIVSDRDR